MMPDEMRNEIRATRQAAPAARAGQNPKRMRRADSGTQHGATGVRCQETGVRRQNGTRPRFDVLTFRRFDFSSPGFTLIEMMIVVGIIVVLVAIALPTAYSVLGSSRGKQTLATMNTIAAAIEQFNRDNPFAFFQNQRVLRQITFPCTPTPKTVNYALGSSSGSGYTPLFGRYPPSPTTAMSIDPAHPDTFVGGGVGLTSPPYPATKEEDTDLPTGATSQAVTLTKFFRLIYVMNGEEFASPDLSPWIMLNDKGQRNTSTAQTYPKPYASIECLIYALRELSPGARNIIDKLPASVLVNTDKDFVFHDTGPGGTPDGAFQTDERQATLFEVVDAWKKPLRYAIREEWPDICNPNNLISGYRFKWELRSAGEDGIFAPPFTEANKSDDVILQGP
jgi:prepilin-type N-terminal cleavage/methylation domain-containing protein